MATYAELLNPLGDQGLKDLCMVAIVVVVDKIEKGLDVGPNFEVSNRNNRLKWARRVMNDVEGAPGEATRMLPAAIASMRALVLADILATSDEDMQTSVEGFVDLFADGS